MCLTIKSNQKKENGKFVPYIAKKAIVCYKKLRKGSDCGRGEYVTPYREAYVRIGETMEASRLGIFRHWEVNEGIHAYVEKKDVSWKYVLVECHIPKGAKYIKGKDGDIVATKMILKKIIKRGR